MNFSEKQFDDIQSLIENIEETYKSNREDWYSIDNPIEAIGNGTRIIEKTFQYQVIQVISQAIAQNDLEQIEIATNKVITGIKKLLLTNALQVSRSSGLHGVVDAIKQDAAADLLEKLNHIFDYTLL